MKEIIKLLEAELSTVKQRETILESTIKNLKWLDTMPDVKPEIDKSMYVQKNDQYIKPNPNRTFKEKVKDTFLELDRPLKGKEIYEHAFAPSNMKYDTFSPQLTGMINNGIIKKHTFSERSNKDKYYYGLSEYFDGDNLKAEYLKKVNG